MRHIELKNPLKVRNWTAHVFLYLITFKIRDGSSNVIHGKYTENIRDYHLAVPHKATVDGEFFTFHLPHFHEPDPKLFKARQKRDLSDPDMVHYGLFVNDELHHIDLWPNRDFIHPHVLIERRDPTVPIHKRDVRGINSLKNMCYYTGSVRGVKNSRAAITTCDGLAGSITIGNKMYFIEPVQEHSPNAKGHHLHVVYDNHPEFNKHFCGVDTSGNNWEKAIKKRLRQDFVNEKVLFKKAAFTVVPQWMQMMITCDKKFLDLHRGKRDVLQWVLTIFNMVKSMYADESMTAQIEPVIVRIILLEKEEDEIDLDISRDVDKTLESFCNWSLKLQQPNNSIHRFDTSLLLSNWDFCHAHNDCAVQGIGMVGNACGPQPCQLNEDKGFVTGLSITHEQGHLLGMTHDEHPPLCPGNDSVDGVWYVMSPTSEAITVKWSPCSLATMREMARNHFLDCFNNEPPGSEYTIPDGLPGVLSSLAEQCTFNMPEENYTDCCNEESCRPIYCQQGDKCYGIDFEAADGTKCGDNHWCFRSKCVEKGARPTAVDGGWGNWTDWTKCSRTCGKGVQTRLRYCDSPKPANKGKYCLGKRQDSKICINQDCSDDQPSFREQQCREKLDPTKFAINVSLASFQYPVVKPDKPCDIICAFKVKTKVIKLPVGKADDGTVCTPGIPNIICIDFKCTEIGCDGKIDSGAVEDRCGICNGDGTMCKVTDTTWTSDDAENYSKIADIPAGARKIEVIEDAHSENFLALGSSDSNTTWYLNGNFRLNPAGTNIIGKKSNMWLYYSGSDAPKERFTLDRATEDLTIYLGMQETDNGNYTYKWVEHADKPAYEPKYAWETDEFGECSVQCGGGTQSPKFHCTEEKAGKVSNVFCEKLDKPSGEPQKCNEKICPTEWKVGSWGRCRACKKKGGVRVRPVECVKRNSKAGADDIIQEDSKCEAPKPGTVELCETLTKCVARRKKSYHIPGKYQESVWKQMKKLHLVKRAATVTVVTATGTRKRRLTNRTTISTRHTQGLFTGSVTIPKKELVIDKGRDVKVFEVERKVKDMGNISEIDENMGMKPGTKIVIGSTKRLPDFMKVLKCKSLKLNKEKRLNKSKMVNSSSKAVSQSMLTKIPIGTEV